MSVESYVGALLLDVAYALIGAADVSREVESELTKLSGVVCERNDGLTPKDSPICQPFRQERSD